MLNKKAIIFYLCLVQVILLDAALFSRTHKFTNRGNNNTYRIDSQAKNKVRVKREHIRNDGSQIVPAMTVSDALRSILNTSEIISEPRSGVTHQFYNGSSIFEKILNESKIKPANGRLNNEDYWQPAKSIPQKEIENPNSDHALNNVIQQPQLQKYNLPQEDKNNIVDLYKKLANDFQILQQYLAEKKKESTKKLEEDELQDNKQKCTTPPSVQTKNIIMLENMCGVNGNFTRITLLKKKTCEKRKDISLPSNVCEGGSCRNVRLQINNQEEAEIISKKE